MPPIYSYIGGTEEGESEVRFHMKRQSSESDRKKKKFSGEDMKEWGREC